MIDLHSHLLPGIDDGPRSMNQSMELARAAVAGGVKTMVATPHVSWEFQNTSERIAALVGELSGRLAEEGVDLEVLPGAELALTHVLDVEPAEVERMRLAGGDWLLLEFPFSPGSGEHLAGVVRQLQSRGHRILLAHPERCPAFQREPELLVRLVEEGALGSLTSASLVGRFGEQVRQLSLRFLREGLIHNVTSDAHDPVRRPPNLAADLREAGLQELAPWLTEAVPRAIIDGGDIPRRPLVQSGGNEGPRRTPLARLLRRPR